jgi:nitroreductase
MDVREALYTTRAMRRVSSDPIPDAVVARIIDAAIHAPSGGNAQNWNFIVVDDREVIGKIGSIYQEAMTELWKTIYAQQIADSQADPDDPDNAQWLRVYRSAQWLQDHFGDVPLLLCGLGDAGSVYPALWSAQLAARAEGVGSAFTSVLSFFNRDETLAALGVPGEGAPPFHGMITFGYPLGRWGVGARKPAAEVMYSNQWGTPLGIDVPGPLWPDA